MDRELELDLAENGFSDLVATLRAAPQARVQPGFAADVLRAIHAEETTPSAQPTPPRKISWRRYLTQDTLLPLAACLALCMAIGSALFRSDTVYSTDRLLACQRADGTFCTTSAATYAQAFAVTALAKEAARHEAALDSAVNALVRDQDASGAWANDHLTARNVAALRLAAEAGVASARRAYKQGLRYLRAHGLSEMSSDDLAREARSAAARLGASADAGLACSLSLCAAS